MDPAPCLPIPRSLHAETLLLDEDGLTILASSETTDARCPVCGGRADRVHSRYARTLADLLWATLPVRLRVSVRKASATTTRAHGTSSPNASLGWRSSPPGAPTANGRP